jgi:hypothetical protein
VIQKSLQITSGLKFIEIIDMIKKVTKTLKYTNYGKKIYENLMNNYGEYLSNANNNKILAKLPKKNMKKGLNSSINNNHINANNTLYCINNNSDNNAFKPENNCDESLKIKQEKKENHLNNNDQVKNIIISKLNEKSKNQYNILAASKGENFIDKKNEYSKNYENKNSDVNKLISRNSYNNYNNINNNYPEDLFADLNKSFSQGRPKNGSLVCKYP